MNALILALALTAPSPGADPAPPTFQVPVNSRVVAPDGRIWTFTGTLTVMVEEAPPKPDGPTITALRNQAGQGVEQIRAGEVLVIEGVQLAKAGAQLRVQVPGHLGTVLSSTPTRLEVRFPTVPAAVTGPLQIYHNQGTGWTLAATGPRVTLLPAQAPGKPLIRSFRDATVEGEGFGTRPGTVYLEWFNAKVSAWSDRQIRLQGVAPTASWYPLKINIETAGGEWASYGGIVGKSGTHP